MISPINPLKDTNTRYNNINATYFLFGWSILMCSLIGVTLLALSGDSTTQRNGNITRLTMPSSKVIR